MSASPLDAADLRTRVQLIITSVLSTEGALLGRISPDLIPLNEALEQFLGGGKRLRPAFLYWGWRGAGGDHSDPVQDQAAMQAATSLEFLQACALIHDDVMDGAATRRGLPAVHERFAGHHRDASWLGDSTRFGVGAAILLGDLCLCWADQILLNCGLPPEALKRAKGVYDEMRTELMAGQYLDLLEQARGGGSTERAMKVVNYKSAKYTIERPLHMGATLAGAEDAVLGAYSEYGLPLGEAFQLRDDVLGVFGDPQETGKPAGDDLREGKRTVLIATTLERATKAQSAVMEAHLGDPALGERGITLLRSIIRDTGALAAIEQQIEQRLAQSLAAAVSPAIERQTQQILLGLAHAATRRSM